MSGLNLLSVQPYCLMVLYKISMQIHSGECVGLLGWNGVGKTTTMRVIAGLNKIEDGHLSFDGTFIDYHGIDVRSRMGIGLVPEDRRIFPDLTVFALANCCVKRIRFDHFAG